MAFNIGGSEILFIIALALIVFGPQRLPTMMREGARLWRQVTRTTEDLRNEFRKALHELEIENPSRPDGAHPPGYDPVTHSVPYVEPDIPHMVPAPSPIIEVEPEPPEKEVAV